MSEVTCKFECNNIVLSKDGGGEVSLQPVVSGSEENDTFFKYTPYGSIKFGTVNSCALTYFVPGEEYIVTFRKAN